MEHLAPALEMGVGPTAWWRVVGWTGLTLLLLLLLLLLPPPPPGLTLLVHQKTLQHPWQM